MARYCCYCGALFLADGRKCETCGRTVVKPPPPVDGEDTDDDSESGSDVEDETLAVPVPKRTRGLANPPSHQDMMYGYVDRFRQEQIHTFHFYSEADGSFILAASMAPNGEGPIYFHTRTNLNTPSTTLEHVPKRKSQQGYLAVLYPSSFLGGEYVLTTKEDVIMKEESDSDSRPKARTRNTAEIPRSRSNISSSNSPGRELALFAFSASLFGDQPNTMSVSVRANPSSHNASEPIKDRVAARNKYRSGADQSLLDRITGKRDRSYRPLGQEEDEDDEIATFETKKPQWSDSTRGWVLDFNGRVTVSSKKNCILVPSQFDDMLYGADTIGVRFGKVGKHRFNLDYRFPFSPLTAMAAAMSMFTNTMAVQW